MNILKSKLFKEQIPHLSRQISLVQRLILALLVLMLVVGTLPGYIAGKWSWSDSPKISHMQYLTKLQKTGLTVPGWTNLDQATIPIGGKKWSVQLSQIPGKSPFFLMLSPQVYYLDQPMIDWLDIQGLEKWKTDSYHELTFQTNNPHSTPVTARLFRAWKTDTFAVVQWYAWPYGGSDSPSRWFWKDQAVQGRRQRVPWIAVCLKVAIDPLGDFKDSQPQILALAQKVQETLETEIFSPMFSTSS